MVDVPPPPPNRRVQVNRHGSVSINRLAMPAKPQRSPAPVPAQSSPARSASPLRPVVALDANPSSYSSPAPSRMSAPLYGTSPAAARAQVHVSRRGSVEINRPTPVPMHRPAEPTYTYVPAPAYVAPAAQYAPLPATPERARVHVSRKGSVTINGVYRRPSHTLMEALVDLHGELGAQNIGGNVSKEALIRSARAVPTLRTLLTGSFGGSDIVFERALRLFGRSAGSSDGSDDTITVAQLERFAALHQDALDTLARSPPQPVPTALPHALYTAAPAAVAPAPVPVENELLERSIAMLETLTLQRDEVAADRARLTNQNEAQLAAAAEGADALQAALQESEHLRSAAARQAMDMNAQIQAVLVHRDDAHRRALVAEQSLRALRQQMSKIAAAEVVRANAAARTSDGRAEQAEIAAQKELAIRQLGAELEAERRATADAQLVAGRAQQTVQDHADRILSLQRVADDSAEDNAARDKRVAIQLAVVEERHAGDLAAEKRRSALALAEIEVAAESNLQRRLDELHSETDESLRRTARDSSEHHLVTSQEIERLQRQLQLAAETEKTLRESMAAQGVTVQSLRKQIGDSEQELAQLRESYSTVVRQRLTDADAARGSLEIVLEENRQLQEHVKDTSALHSEHIGVVQDSLGSMVEMRRILIQVLSDEVPYTHYKVRLPDLGAVVRQTPDLTSEVVATLPFETIVEVKERVVDEKGMVRMRVVSGSVEGWVSSFLRGNTTRILMPTVVAPEYQTSSPRRTAAPPAPAPVVELATPAPSVRVNRHGSVLINTPGA